MPSLQTSSLARPEAETVDGLGPGAPTTDVFGLDVRCRFDAPGLADLGDGRAWGPRVVVSPARASEVRPRPHDRAERLIDRRLADGTEALTIDRGQAGELWVYAAGYGSFVLSSTATEIVCAPADVADWQWQRYLVGQMLPIAAVLHGYEILHASAVAIEDRAICFAAASGVGKTSVALNMVHRGAGFLTDDVVALGRTRSGLVVQPGAAIANLRHEEHKRLAGTAVGRVLGRDSHGLRVALSREMRPLPLAAIYLLERVTTGQAPTLLRIDPDFRQLLANGFDFLISSPDRARNQLDVYASIARQIPVFRVSVPPGVDAASLAEFVADHAPGLGRSSGIG